MTITPAAPTLNTPVQVRFTPAGTPLAIRHDGQIWSVDPELDTAHWYTRGSWWETRQTIPAGIGNVVDIEHWQVQVRHTSASPPFEPFTSAETRCLNSGCSWPPPTQGQPPRKADGGQHHPHGSVTRQAPELSVVPERMGE